MTGTYPDDKPDGGMCRDALEKLFTEVIKHECRDKSPPTKEIKHTTGDTNPPENAEAIQAILNAVDWNKFWEEVNRKCAPEIEAYRKAEAKSRHTLHVFV